MGASHGWVPVDTHSTPVPSSEERLWVARHSNTAPNKMSPNSDMVAFNAFLRTDSLQEENKTRRDDRPSSSHLSTFSGKIQMKKHPVKTLQFPRKRTITAIGNVIRMSFVG